MARDWREVFVKLSLRLRHLNKQMLLSAIMDRFFHFDRVYSHIRIEVKGDSLRKDHWVCDIKSVPVCSAATEWAQRHLPVIEDHGGQPAQRLIIRNNPTGLDLC